MICTLLTAIMTIAVIFMPKMMDVETLSDITVVGYKYYKDEVVHIVTSGRENYELYSEKYYPIGMSCLGTYDVFQGNNQRNMIKENDVSRMIIAGINGKIYEDSSTDCHKGHLSFGMKINQLRDMYIQHILKQTDHDYKYDMLTLSIGNKSYIDSELFEALQKLGIYHLYVISGTHVAFLTGVLYFVLKRTRIPLEWIKIILIIMLMCFLFLNLFSPSVVRAVLMAVLLLLTSFTRSRPYMTIISLTAIFQFLYHPNIIYHAGFQLSYVTTYFILLTKQYILNRKPLAQLLAITVISEISTLLLLLIHFNEVSLSGVIMNIIFVPLFSVIIFPTVILFNFASFFGLNGLFDEIFHHIFTLLKAVIMYLSTSYPHRMNIINIAEISVVILLITTVTSIMAICKNKLKLIVISITVFFTTVMINQYVSVNDFKVTMIDVGQGDAFLIQDLRNKKAILVDTGGRFYYETPHIRLSDRTVLPYLKEAGINRLDLVVLSHIDLDHVGEFQHIASKTTIDYVMANVRDPAFMPFWTLDIPLVDPLHNKTIQIGDIKVSVLMPYDETFTDESNESSIVLHVLLGDYSILFTGDAGLETEIGIMEKYQPFDVDILKVGHHGSETSTSREFVAWSKPHIALISAGVDNRYGHPHKGVVEALNNQLILSTADAGMVELVIRDERLCIETKLGGEGRRCVVK